MAEMIRALSRADSSSSHNSNSLVNNKAVTKIDDDLSDLLAASEAVPDLIPVRTAIATVFNKDGLTKLGLALARFGVHVIATSGTAKHLQSVKDLNLTDLTVYTGYPENLNGRLKTLHTKVQAGVLAIKGKHDATLKKAAAEYIELVIVNLYPFAQAVSKGASFLECIENIDIGGPALLRAAAKNHSCVAALCDPADYDAFITEITHNNGRTSLEFRRRCAQKVFELTSTYDNAIARWFAQN